MVNCGCQDRNESFSSQAGSRLDVHRTDSAETHCGLFSQPGQLQQKYHPSNRENLDAAEKAIARDMYNLSHKERQEVVEDIHGVSEMNKETPDRILKAKADLETYLMNNLGTSEAFSQVWMQASDYVRGLYLMFLRCDDFNILNAGNRVFVHFDTKLRLFGRDKLCHNITLQDFSREDMDSYRAGFFQVIPVRDRAGRPVCIKLWKLQKFQCRENVWRQIWYMHMSLLEDEETQRKGMVQIVYNINDKWIETFDDKLYRGVADIRAATPIRMNSVHYCFSDPAFGAIIKLVTLAMEMNTRTRTRLHYGSDTEVLYELQGYGIPIASLPVNSAGTFRTKAHDQWLKVRKSQESRHLSVPRIVVPSHDDILFGRGKVLQSHVGNMRLANIIEEEMDRYVQVKKAQRVIIAKEVIQKIFPGRFLRQDKDGVWEQVGETIALDKVGHSFRNRKPTGSTTNKASPVSATSKRASSGGNYVDSTVLPHNIERSVTPSDDSSHASSTTSIFENKRPRNTNAIEVMDDFFLPDSLLMTVPEASNASPDGYLNDQQFLF